MLGFPIYVGSSHIAFILHRTFKSSKIHTTSQTFSKFDLTVTLVTTNYKTTNTNHQSSLNSTNQTTNTKNRRFAPARQALPTTNHQQMPECINCHRDYYTYPTYVKTPLGITTAPVCQIWGLTNLDIPDIPGFYLTLTRHFVFCLCCLHWLHIVN